MRLPIGLLIVACVLLFAGSSAPPVRAQQSVTRNPDEAVIAQIRREGLSNSHVMTFITELADGIGPRLMGSPNMHKAYDWALGTFRNLGAENVHLEDIGEFGLSWRENNVWARMSSPDPMVFLVQAAPWSVSSNGPKEADVAAIELNSPADFDTYRGSLRGKIVLLGPMRDVLPTTEAFTKHWTPEEVISGKAAEFQRGYHQRRANQRPPADGRDFAAEKRAFLVQEGVAAVVLQTAESSLTRGGATGLIFVDRAPFGPMGWTAETRIPFPVLVIASENFGRAWRLSKAGTPVKIQFNVDSEVLNEHEHGYNVVAEIPGIDPKLKSEVVILGAHLDSWAAATGATDNGAGVTAVLETLRILKASGAKPRRTVRFILYAEEEEGLVGSTAYATKHLGYSTGPTPRDGEVIRQHDLKVLPENGKISAAYVIDDGTGKLLGVYAGGNPKLAAIFGSWLPDLKDLGVLAVLDERSFFSDQAPYQSVGIPGISFVQDPLDYFTRTHHSNLDTVEHIVPGDLSQAATVASIFVIRTADWPERMPRIVSPP